MKQLLLVIAIHFLSVFASAGQDGGGGAAVLSNGKWYLFDFIEAGIEKSPYINKTNAVPTEIVERVKTAMAALPGAPYELVAHKLYEIYLYDKYSYLRFVQLIEHLSWRTTDKPLKPADDHLDTTIDLSNVTFGWAAFRTGSVVTIHKHYWNLLDPENKAGLIFHEIVYAATYRDMLLIAGNRAYYYGSLGIDPSETHAEKLEANKKARNIVSELFLATFSGTGKKKAFRLIDNDASILSSSNAPTSRVFEAESEGQTWAIALKPTITVFPSNLSNSDKHDVDPKTADLNQVADKTCKDMKATADRYMHYAETVTYKITPNFVAAAQTPDFNYAHGLKFWPYTIKLDSGSRYYNEDFETLLKLGFNVKTRSNSYGKGNNFDLKKCVDDVKSDLESVMDNPIIGTAVEI